MAYVSEITMSDTFWCNISNFVYESIFKDTNTAIESFNNLSIDNSNYGETLIFGNFIDGGYFEFSGYDLDNSDAVFSKIYLVKEHEYLCDLRGSISASSLVGTISYANIAVYNICVNFSGNMYFDNYSLVGVIDHIFFSDGNLSVIINGNMNLSYNDKYDNICGSVSSLAFEISGESFDASEGNWDFETLWSFSTLNQFLDYLIGDTQLSENLITGSSGNDIISGSGDFYDILVLSGLPSQYLLYGSTMTGIEGLDTVSSIEQYRFGSSLGNILYVSNLSANALIDPDGSGPAVSPAKALLQNISDIYVAYFNRAPDVAGLMYWFAEISKGSLTLTTTAQSFTDSPEYKAAYPVGQSNHDFVNAIYQNLFDRAPDTAGWAYWENDLNNGTPRDSFINTVILGAYAPTGSPSDKSLLNNKHDVALYYSEQLATHSSMTFDNNIDQVLNRVSADTDTVAQAETVIDYVISHSVNLAGVINDTATWNAIWA